jgi:hypothetical protein
MAKVMYAHASWMTSGSGRGSYQNTWQHTTHRAPHRTPPDLADHRNTALFTFLIHLILPADPKQQTGRSPFVVARRAAARDQCACTPGPKKR